MEKIVNEIELSGISTNINPEVCKDGECVDIVNMKCSNGSWALCNSPKTLIEKNEDDRHCRFIHCNMDYSNFISYDGVNVYWEASYKDNGVVEGEKKLIHSCEDLEMFESMGNILILICKSGCHYALFNNNEYCYIGDIDMPRMNFTLNRFFSASFITSTHKLPTHMYGSLPVKEENKISLSEFINSLIEKAYKDTQNIGLFTAPFMIRYAIKLFDGSYIKASPPVLLTIDQNIRDKEKFLLTVNSSETSANVPPFFFYYEAYELLFNCDYVLPKEWKDIISSIDVFISKPLLSHTNKHNKCKDYRNEIVDTGVFKVGIQLDALTDEELKSAFTDEVVFYKIASFDIKDMDKHVTKDGSLKRLEFSCNLNDMELQDTLQIDNFSHYQISGKTSYTYNSKLHLGDIKRYLPQPFSIYTFMDNQTNFNGVEAQSVFNNAVKSHTKVTLATVNGNKYVEKSEIINNKGALSAFISYPDSRAVKIEFWVEDSDGNKFYSQLPLTPSKIENSAIYISEDYGSIVFEPFEGDMPWGDKFEYENFPNLLRISETENPIFFPQERSYSISNGKILKIAAVTTELSVGRYGEFPLYVFCDNGIWALQQGDDSVVYSAQHPVSRDIALSNKSIVNIDKAIVFLSERGINILEGNSSSLFLPFGEENSSEILEERKVEGKEFSIESGNNISYNFRDFINNAQMGFDYRNNDIVFLKPGENYLYSLSLNNGLWSRRQFGESPLDCFINKYPLLFVSYRNGTLIDYSHEDTENNKPIPFIVATRAIKGVRFTHKHLNEVLIKGNINNIADEIFIEVLGSMFPDRGFSILNKLKVTPSFADGIRVPVVSSPYRYYRIAIYGNGKKGLNFNNLILSYKVKYR